MSRLGALRALVAGLRGAPPADCDWMAVLQLANEALVTPQLHAAIAAAGNLHRLPPDVRAFTEDVCARNRERNRRLIEQLAEAVAALNGAGIEPVLLKGAALWVAAGRPDPFDRMMNDLDLLVRPQEAQPAIAALAQAGFDVAKRHEGPKVHVVAELGRASDVGFIDLHQRPPGPPGLAEIEDLGQRSAPIAWRGLSLRTPEPELQVFFLVLHDQFHDGDYWRGGLALRHLLDITALTRGPAAFDWARLQGLARTGLARHALETQLVAAARLAEAQVPRRLSRRPWARLQHARAMAQFRWPGLAQALGAAAMASEAPWILAHRAADRADRRRLFGERGQTATWRDRLERLHHIFGGFADGKI